MLTWAPDQGPHPNVASPKFLLAVMTATQIVDSQEGKTLLNLFRKTKIRRTTELTDRRGNAISLRQHCIAKNFNISEQEDVVLNKMETLLPHEDAGDIQWNEAKGWRWTGINHSAPTAWEISTAQWRALLHEDKDETTDLNRKWDTQDTTEKWNQRWTQLCGGGTTLRTKIRFWRKRWLSWLIFQEEERTTSYATGEPLLDVVDKALAEHRSNLAILLLLLTTWRVNWSERNDLQFQDKNRYRGLTTILNEIKEEVDALKNTNNVSDKRADNLVMAERTISHWTNETRRWLAGERVKQPEPIEPSSTPPEN
ncbi:hypothetical protein R1sor_004082 [Riccia sorocarpa]|uniref:Uncharacterized protein n=1 Tax=Riccia sorocarpa TaxID=122646 RepID=A0ABD3H706_9MARC